MTTLHRAAGERFTLHLTLNGQRRSGEAEPRMLLCDFLRHELQAFGVHVGCEHGVCGACTVLLDGRAVRSCTQYAAQADGADIRTIEGMANADGTLHALQEGFREMHGLQCGFCTPGMIVRAYRLLQENKNPSEEEIRFGISGNLCRCTGFVRIFESVVVAASMKGATPDAR